MKSIKFDIEQEWERLYIVNNLDWSFDFNGYNSVEFIAIQKVVNKYITIFQFELQKSKSGDLYYMKAKILSDEISYKIKKPRKNTFDEGFASDEIIFDGDVKIYVGDSK